MRGGERRGEEGRVKVWPVRRRCISVCVGYASSEYNGRSFDYI